MTTPERPPVEDRRGFLAWLAGLAGAAAAALITIPFVGYLASALRRQGAGTPYLVFNDVDCDG